MSVHRNSENGEFHSSVYHNIDETESVVKRKHSSVHHNVKPSSFTPNNVKTFDNEQGIQSPASFVKRKVYRKINREDDIDDLDDDDLESGVTTSFKVKKTKLKENLRKQYINEEFEHVDKLNALDRINQSAYPIDDFSPFESPLPNAEPNNNKSQINSDYKPFYDNRNRRKQESFNDVAVSTLASLTPLIARKKSKRKRRRTTTYKIVREGNLLTVTKTKGSRSRTRTYKVRGMEKEGEYTQSSTTIKYRKAAKKRFVQKAVKKIQRLKKGLEDGMQIQDRNESIKNSSITNNIVNHFKDSFKAIKKSVSLVKFLIGILPILVVCFFLLFIVLMLFDLKPTEDLKPLKDAVYLTNQNYKAQLISEKTELYGLGDDTAVNYRGISVSWKNILCYWYVYGSDIGIPGVDPIFYEGMDVSSVKDKVLNTTLSKPEMDSLTECFNTLNTIISYPDTEIAYYENIDVSSYSDDDIAALVAEGGIYNEEKNEVNIPIKQECLNVNITRLTAQEAGKSNFSKEADYEKILDHIDRCMRAVEEDNSSLEPVFYELWKAVREETNITMTGRDLICKEAIALWIITGCNGDLPSSIYLEYFEPKDKNNDGTNDVYTFEYTFYRYDGDEEDIPWDLYFEIPYENPNMLKAVREYEIYPIKENDTVVFLDPENGYGWNCTYNDGEYSFEINNEINIGVGTMTHHLNSDSFKYSNLSWQDYSYRCIGSSGTGAWCDAFVNSLAQNMYPGGCFFTYNKFYIDSEHSGWEEWNPDEQNWEADGKWSWSNAMECLDGINISNFTDKVGEFLYVMQNIYSSVEAESFFNELHLTAETDYYRINLMGTPSRMYYGLENQYTIGEHKFTPRDGYSHGYRPRRDLLGYLYISSDDSYGEQENQDPSVKVEYNTETGVPMPMHDGSQNRGFVTNAGVDNSGYHIGHEEGWYAPKFMVSSEYGEDLDLVDLFQAIGVAYYGCTYNWDEEIANWCIHLIDGISDWRDDGSTGMTMGDYLNSQSLIDRLMYYNCGLFGEIMEETQHLFYNEAYCPTNLNRYYNNGMVFSPEDLGELGELEPGDVIFYDWDTDDTPADGVSDHVGLVVGVNKNEIYVIEGNMNDSLGIRTIRSYTTYSSAMAFVDVDYGANDN